MQPGVLLPLITLGVISSGLMPGALIDTCGNRPPREYKKTLLSWGSSFTAAIKKIAHVAPEAQILHGKSQEGDGRSQEAAIEHLRSLKEG